MLDVKKLTHVRSHKTKHQISSSIHLWQCIAHGELCKAWGAQTPPTGRNSSSLQEGGPLPTAVGSASG